STVTVTVVLASFPLISVLVTVTTFAPMSSQVNVSGEALSVAPQLSLPVAARSSKRMVASPDASSCTVKSCAETVGISSSTTVTVTTALAVWLAGSVAVRVTVLGPKLLQSNVLGDTDSDTAQSSVLPSSTSAATM